MTAQAGRYETAPTFQWRRMWRPISIALTVTGFLFGLVLIRAMPTGTDATIYWQAHGSLYSGVEGDRAYLYSPAFAQALAPLRLLPVDVFVLLFRIAELACLVWLGGPWTLPLLVAALPVTGELLVGNIHLLMAAAIVGGFRYPGLWVFVALTKPTSAVGLLYFVGAGDWRALRQFGVVMLLIVAVSFLLGPSLWIGWIGAMTSSIGVPQAHEAGFVDVSLFLRVPLAAVLALVGGRLRWRWTVPVAACLALPTLWLIGLSMLVAAPLRVPWLGHKKNARPQSRQGTVNGR